MLTVKGTRVLSTTMRKQNPQPPEVPGAHLFLRPLIPPTLSHVLPSNTGEISTLTQKTFKSEGTSASRTKSFLGEFWFQKSVTKDPEVGLLWKFLTSSVITHGLL